MTLARLDVIILSLLAADDRTGYDILKWLERHGTFAGYSTQQSQIYRQLTRMESVGWAVSRVEERERGPDAKVYRVTDKGAAELDRWIDSPYVPAARPLDPDFQVRLMFSVSRGPTKALELVRTELAFRRATEEYRTKFDLDLLPRNATPEQAEWFREAWRLQSERGHYMAQTLMAWLESAVVRLEAEVELEDRRAAGRTVT